MEEMTEEEREKERERELELRMEALRTGKIAVYKGLEYHLRDDDTYELCCGERSLECFDIPSELNGKPVTTINSNVFSSYYTEKLQSVIIPSSVTKVYRGVFSSILDKNINVTIDSDNPAYMYRDGGFYSKDGKILYVVRCAGTTFHIPEGVTDIENGALNRAFTTIIIPTSVKRLGHGIFPLTNKNTWFTIFYKGSKADWANLDIDKANEWALTKAMIYYYSETPSGDSWHYAADGITPEITHTSFLTKLIVKFRLKVKLKNLKDSYKKYKEKK